MAEGEGHCTVRVGLRVALVEAPVDGGNRDIALRRRILVHDVEGGGEEFGVRSESQSEQLVECPELDQDHRGLDPAHRTFASAAEGIELAEGDILGADQAVGGNCECKVGLAVSLPPCLPCCGWPSSTACSSALRCRCNAW